MAAAVLPNEAGVALVSPLVALMLKSASLFSSPAFITVGSRKLNGAAQKKGHDEEVG